MQEPHSNSESTASSTSCDSHRGALPPRSCVLIRGLIRSRFHWNQFPTELLKLDSIEEVMMPELAGNGDRSLEHSPSTIQAMVEDIRAQILLLNPNPHQPLTLVAISMGAMIAAEWARSWPDEIAELHLINTSFGNFSRPWQRMQPRALGKLLRLAPRLLQDPAALEQVIHDMTLNLQHNSDTVRGWKQFAREHPMSAANIIFQIKAAGAYSGPHKAPCERTFLYASEGDKLVSASCSQAIAKAWNKPLFLHPTAGHDLPLDDSGWLLENIERATRS